MKGYVRQRTKGSWEITIDVGRDPATGKRRRHSETIRGTKRDAERRLAELLVNIERGSYIKPKKITVGEWLNDWGTSYVATNCSLRTLDSYRSEIENHIVPSLGSILLTQLRPQHLQSYYAAALAHGRIDGKGGLSQRTVQYQHRIISESLDHAVKMGFLARNVADAVDPPHPKRHSMATLKPEDVPQFLNWSRGTRFHALYCTALFTGMRLGELLGLRWCDVDLDLATLSISQALLKRRGLCHMVEPKSAYSRRSIAISPAVAILLRHHRAQQEMERIMMGTNLKEIDLVFANSDGNPLDPGTVTKTFSRVLAKAGLTHIRFHDLRHTHATLMLKAGIHPKIVQERLGHGSIAVTLDTYSHVVSGLQELAVQRFEGIFDKEVLKILTNTEVPNESKCRQNVGIEEKFQCEPHRTRTCNRLIKSQLLCQLS